MENSWPRSTSSLRFSGFFKGNSCICNSVTSSSLSKFHFLFKSMIRRKISKRKEEDGRSVPLHSRATTFFSPNVACLAVSVWFLLARAYMTMSKQSITQARKATEFRVGIPRVSDGSRPMDSWQVYFPRQMYNPTRSKGNGIFSPSLVLSYNLSPGQVLPKHCHHGKW